MDDVEQNALAGLQQQVILVGAEERDFFLSLVAGEEPAEQTAKDAERAREVVDLYDQWRATGVLPAGLEGLP